MTIILRILFNALGLFLIAGWVDGIIVDSFYPALIAALVLGILNVTIRPILFILTLPITILTLGLFAFVINALMFLFAASFIDGFEAAGFWQALGVPSSSPFGVRSAAAGSTESQPHPKTKSKAKYRLEAPGCPSMVPHGSVIY